MARIMRLWLPLLCSLLICHVATAQTAFTHYTQPDINYELRDGQAPGSITPQDVRDAVGSATPAVFDIRNYGARCDGTTHSITSTLGVSTVAALAAYTTPSGLTPYSWINNGNWGVKIALPLANAAASSATSLTFNQGTLKIPTGASVTGTGVAGGTTVSSVTNPGTVTQTINNAGGYAAGTTSMIVTTGTATPVGSHPTPQAGISFDDVVVSSTTTNVTLRYGLTAAITQSTVLTFQPPSIVVVNNGLSAGKPALDSVATQSTAGANYWVYFSWALTDAMVAAAEMDWLGTQAAIEAATAAAAGGLVQIPGGTGDCMMNNATVANSTLGGLVIHETTIGSNNFPTVSMAGMANTSSFLYWPTDAGPGRVGMSFGYPYGTFDNGVGRYSGSFYFGMLRDLSLVGPNFLTTPTMGTWGPRMTGLQAGARRNLNNLIITGWGVALTYEGVDHTDWNNLLLQDSAIGLREGAVSINLYGNNVINHLEIVGSSIASISLDKDSLWTATDIHTFSCVIAPKCIQLEPGIVSTYASNTGQQMTYSEFDSVLAEALGNCFICDNNLGTFTFVSGGTGGGAMHIMGMFFNNVALSYTAGNKPTGTLMKYWIMGQSYESKIRFTNNIGLTFVAAMSAGIWMDFDTFGKGGLGLDLDLINTIANFGSTPLVTGPSTLFSNQQNYEIRFVEQGAIMAHLEMVNDASSRAAGVPMSYTTGSGGADRSVVLATNALPFAGINMQTTTNGQPTIIATKMCSIAGVTPTLLNNGTATVGNYAVMSTTAGAITNGSGGAVPVITAIGLIMSVTGTATRVNVGWLGSCD